jgi:hypothetical protein
VPITYQIDADNRTLWTKGVGHVTLQQVIDHFRTLEQDPQIPERIDVFLDLSEVDSLPEPSQLTIVIKELTRIRTKVCFNACAIVATSDALFGMMRMFEVQAEEFFRAMCVFRIATEAQAWLLLQQSSRYA